MNPIDDLEKQAQAIRARLKDMKRLLGRYHTEMIRLQEVPGTKGAWQRHRLQADIVALKENVDALTRDLAGIEQGAIALRGSGERRIAA